MKESKFNNRVGNAMIGALLFLFVILFAAEIYAGPTDDNHIHVEQVDGGDDLNLNITDAIFESMQIRAFIAD